jgi:phosphatidylserine/phosphatidylglycerophosphate/cardiolipin synthase-like enzyme/uncharacterized membrane protein YdjX (TVP38/TMEM64 family)
MEDNRILVPGRNCWRLEKADRISFLVDGEEYFQTFREAAKLARRSIFICGWDIDSRLSLVRDKPGDGLPARLGDFLNALAEKNEKLRIHILIWDFVRFIGVDREWFLEIKLGWETHANIHFHLDNYHPVGASHHHKLVVMDDVLAFAGGLDLTKNRWDTSEHAGESERRKNPDGETYRPHHDLQMMVAGKPASSLGEYFRYHWGLASGTEIPSPDGGTPEPVWPAGVEPDLGGCKVGIARTRPRYREMEEIREAEQLYLDSIEKAADYIYVENQYLTSPKIITALAKRLQQEDGPEIVMVLPFATDGWLSQYTMDVLRARAVGKLQEADRGNRLGLFYAYREGLEEDNSIKIHAKLMICDDLFARIGSSNLNNRSMGLDTECDLAVECDPSSADGGAIRRLRDTLLAEHLGSSPSEVDRYVRREGSLLKAVAELRGGARSLERLEPGSADIADLVVEEQSLFDPERPVEPENLIRKWLPDLKVKKGRYRMIQLSTFILFLLGAAAAWRFTPLQEYLVVDRLKEVIDFLKSSRMAWFYTIGAYVAGGLLVLPITLLITLTFLVFGIYEGIILALAGSALSGAATYWLGRILGRDIARALAGDKLTSLSKKIGRRGIFSTFVIRLMPIAPYTVINVVAGASHISFFDFLIGTVLGLIPGILAIGGIVDRGYAMLSNPDPATVLSAVAVLATVGGAFYVIRKKLRQE